MSFLKKIRLLASFSFAIIFMVSCEGMPGADAKKYPPNPDLRVQKNLEEGRGFRLDSAFKKSRGGDFLFASSNELWRASLDTIDFMPLSSVNYSGGIIITDWYPDGKNLDEAVKISIRFLSNEVRADALDIKIFYKNCNQMVSCKITQNSGQLLVELKREILSKAAIYKKENKDKNFKEYKGSKKLAN